VDDSNKDKERFEWQALKLKVQWESLTQEAKTDAQRIKEEQKNQSPEATTEIIPPPNQNDSHTLKLIFGIATAVFVLVILLLASINSGNHQRSAIVKEPQSALYKSVPLHVESYQQRNMRIVKQIVETYHRTHTYSKEERFVCEQMAIDVWNMVKTQGIKAKIAVGNVKKDIIDSIEADHAWVLAEVSPDNWIALETTGGYLVCSDQSVCRTDNERYYIQSWHFNNPRELEDFKKQKYIPCITGYVRDPFNRCIPFDEYKKQKQEFETCLAKAYYYYWREWDRECIRNRSPKGCDKLPYNIGSRLQYQYDIEKTECERTYGFKAQK